MLIEVIAEVTIGALRVAGRVLAEIFLHGIVEIGVQGTGYLLCRPFNRSVPPDGGLATTVGLVFWLVAGVAGYLVYTTYLASGEP